MKKPCDFHPLSLVFVTSNSVNPLKDLSGARGVEIRQKKGSNKLHINADFGKDVHVPLGSRIDKTPSHDFTWKL